MSAQQTSMNAKDKLFIAAAKKLGAMSDEQLKDCLKAAFERRKLGVEKDLGDVALDKGYIEVERFKAIAALMAKATIKKTDSEGSGSEPKLGALSGSPGRSPGKASGELAARAEADLIDGYVIAERIGAGAMATVYRARHKVLDKEVALKVLHPEFSKSPEYVGRFLREARAAARIDHANVVRIHDAGDCRGRHFIAMELLSGPNLQSIVARDGPLSEVAALQAAREVARALEAAAQERIVHRDVKPANVARTPDGRVKLLDLGLARATHRVGDDGTITDHGKTLGTPFFVSPEQARGEELDARSDIYSLGVTLFFLLTGEHPFTGATAPEVMKRHIVDPVPSIRVLRPSLSPEVDTLLQKMLAKDLKRRYQSPRELVAALDLLVSGEAGARPEPESDEEREARDPKQRRRDEKRERAEERKERAEEKRAAAGAKPKPAAHAHAAAAKAAAAPSMTSTRRLAYACAGMGGLLVLLLVIHASQRPAAADTAPRAEVADASKHAAPEAADLAKKDTLPGDFYAAKKRADEDKDGKPQEALAYWRQVFPPAERRGALKAAVEAEEAAIKAAVQQRFAADLARAAQERQEGHQRIAHRIYERVKLYGGIAEKARAEQELAKCDAEEVAAGAAGASQAAPSAKDRDTFAQMLKELAPVVLAGDYDKAVARARELAAGMAAGASQNRAEDAGKLIGELHLLDAACAKAIEELAGANLEEPLEFKLTSGKTIVGKIRAVDPDGKVAVTSQAGGYEFSIAQLSPSEKEKYATLAKGRTNDIERLLTIQSLYTGDYDDALRRAERLGMTTLLEHVRFVRDIAMPGAPAPAPKSDALVAGGPAPSRGAPAAEPDAAKPDAASSEPAAPQAAPVRPPAQPPPTSAPPPSKEPSAAPPGASKFERVFGDLLKAPVTCEKDSIFTAEYAWTPGSEETLRDWTIVKPAFKSGFTARGYQLICGAKQVARLAYKVPLAQPYDLTMTVHFEQVSEESSFLVTLGEKGGEDFAIDCGQAAYRRERGQVLQFLKRPSRPPGSMCKLRADIALKVHVDDDAVSVEWDGKKTLDGVKVKRGDGVIGLEVAGCQVDVRDLKIRAQPEPSWFLEQKAKIHD